jgi:hypothetical protein
LIRIKLKGGVILPLILLICISCAASLNNNFKKTDHYIQLKERQNDKENIEDFIDSFVFNKRDIGLIYKFEKGYAEDVLGNTIRDFYTDGNLLLFFNNELLFTNSSKCLSMELKKKYDTITYSNDYIALATKKLIDFYSLKYCGQLSVKHIKRLSNFLLFNSFIIFYEGKDIIIDSIIDGKNYLTIRMEKEILNVLDLNGKVISIINKDGTIILLDILKKKVIKVIDLGIPIIYAATGDNNIFFLNNNGQFNVYNTESNNKKFLMTLKYDWDIIDLHEVYMAKQYPALIVKNKLIEKDRVVNLFSDYGNVVFDIIDSNNFIYLKGGRLVLVYVDKPRYIKKVIFNNFERNGCIANDIIVFKDLDSKYKGININTGALLNMDSYSDSCNTKITLKDGYFFLNNNKSLKFADIVKEWGNNKLLMRIIDNIYYFYVE